MRFMMIMIPNVDEQNWTPDAEAIKQMGQYNEELGKAGILLSLDGLHPTAEGARLTFDGSRAAIADGPFTEAKEVIGGFWIIDVRDKAEAVAWAARCPAEAGNVIEVRRVYELSDFPEDVQAVALEEEAGRIERGTEIHADSLIQRHGGSRCAS